MLHRQLPCLLGFTTQASSQVCGNVDGAGHGRLRLAACGLLPQRQLLVVTKPTRIALCQVHWSRLPLCVGCEMCCMVSYAATLWMPVKVRQSPLVRHLLFPFILLGFSRHSMLVHVAQLGCAGRQLAIPLQSGAGSGPGLGSTCQRSTLPQSTTRSGALRSSVCMLVLVPPQLGAPRESSRCSLFPALLGLGPTPPAALPSTWQATILRCDQRPKATCPLPEPSCH